MFYSSVHEKKLYCADAEQTHSNPLLDIRQQLTKAKATIKIPIGMDCGGTGNGSVKPMNNKYTLPSIL